MILLRKNQTVAKINKNCSLCNGVLKNNLKEEQYQINGKVLTIQNIPSISCSTQGCSTEYYSADVLSKRQIIIAQFERDCANSFTGKEVIVTYPSLLLKNRQFMYI